MIETLHHFLHIAVANTQFGSKGIPFFRRRLGSAHTVMVKVHGRKFFLRRHRGVTHLGKCLEDCLRLSLLNAHIMVGQSFTLWHKGLSRLRKALRQITADSLPCPIRVGEDDDAPLLIGCFNLFKGIRRQGKAACFDCIGIKGLLDRHCIHFSFYDKDFLKQSCHAPYSWTSRSGFLL